MKFLALVVLAVAFQSALAQEEGCGFVGISNTTIIMDPVLEAIAANATIWSAETFNVVGAAAVASPHTKYLRGLRYPTRYEYQSTDVTKDFILVEHALEIVRDVIFTCADGSVQPIKFIVPLIDDNNQRPTFEYKAYEAEVSLSDNSTEPTSANIVVSDGDYEYEHADVIIRSSNLHVTPFVDPLWSGENPSPYAWRVDFFVSKNMALGDHEILLTADDGKNSDFTVVTITVKE